MFKYLLLMVISVIINFFNVPIFLGIDLLLGGIFVFYILLRYDLQKAIIASFLSASVTFYHWGHYYAVIIFLMETLFVGYFYYKNKNRNIVFINLFYWLIVGCPLVVIFYKFFLNTPDSAVYLIMLKQSVNGILNSLLAYFIFNLLPFFIKSKKRIVNLQSALFTLLVMFLLIPSLIIVMNNAEKSFKQIESEIKLQLEVSANNLNDYFKKWFDDILYVLEQTEKKVHKVNSPEELQNDLEILVNSRKSFHNMYIADSNAVTIAFYPLLNENNESNIGLDYSERDYYKQLKSTMKPYISEVFKGRGGISQPIITASVPITKNNEFNGYILAAIDLNEINNIIKKFYNNFEIKHILVDNKNKIIAAFDSKYLELSDFNNFNDYIKTNISDNFFKIVPEAVKGLPAVQQWGLNKYVFSEKIVNDWTIFSLLKSQPYRINLYNNNISNLLLIFILLYISVILSYFLSKQLISPISELIDITDNLPEKINQDYTIKTPDSKIEEFNNLYNRFRYMVEKLKEYISALQKNKNELEKKVEEKTAELKKSNIELLNESAEKQNLIEDLQIREKAIEASNEGIIITDALNGNKIVMVNKAFEQISGYTFNEIKGKNPRFLQGKNTDPKTVSKIRNALINNEPVTVEVLNYKKNGVPYWNIVSIAQIKNSDGIVTHCVGTQSDISNIKENQMQINAIITTAPNAIITINYKGIIEMFNPTAEKMFQYSNNEVVGKNVKILMDDTIDTIDTIDGINKIDENYIENFLTSDVKNYLGNTIEFTAKRKNKEVIPIQLSVSEVDVNDRKLFTAIIQDISERKQFEEKLKEAKLLAEKANEAKSAFLASVSHEIRTPMNAIVSMAHFLEKTGLNNEQNEFLDVLKNSSESLMLLIEDILDISKLENLHDKINLVAFNFREFISKTISIIDLKIKEKNIKFNHYLDKDIPQYLITDNLRLKQILLNVLSNAIKFTDKGTVDLLIELENKTEKRCEIIFIVKDTGIGIPDSKKNIIFEKFYQADETVNRKYGGTGLGLAITKEIVNLLDGRIIVEDNKPKGSIFKIFLKFDIAEDFDNNHNNNELNNVEIDKNVKLNMLVAEDDKTNQFIIKKLLEKYSNINLILSNDGKDAVEKFKNENINLILMDINMPEMDGFTTVEKIRAFEENSNYKIQTPIMMFTATTKEQFINKLDIYNIVDVILKPVVPNDFYNKIDYLIKLSSTLFFQQKSTNNITENNTIVTEPEDTLNNSNTLIQKWSAIGKDILDINKILTTLDNETELYIMMVEQYMSDYGSNIDTIKDFFNKKIVDKMIFFAHKLVTSSANVGAYKLSSMSKEIENKLNNKEECSDELFADFFNEMNKVNETLNKILKLL